jgi:hypothetical protein
VLRGVGEVRKRLGVGAAEVEKVAWVLGKEGVNCEDEVGEEVGEEEVDEAKEEEGEGSEEVEKPVKKAAGKGTKRKAPATKTPTEGTRKSARTKM